MATLSIAEFLKDQQARLEQGRQQIAAARLAADTGKELPPDVLRASQRRELDNLKLQLARTEAARAQALERYDAQIARLKAAITGQEEDGQKIDEVLAGGRPKPRPSGGDAGGILKPAAAKVAAAAKKVPKRGAKR